MAKKKRKSKTDLALLLLRLGGQAERFDPFAQDDGPALPSAVIDGREVIARALAPKDRTRVARQNAALPRGRKFRTELARRTAKAIEQRLLVIRDQDRANFKIGHAAHELKIPLTTLYRWERLGYLKIPRSRKS